MEKQIRKHLQDLCSQGNKESLEMWAGTFQVLNNRKAETYCLMLVKLC